MTKKQDSKLTMHKLLGNHEMVTVQKCKHCGIQEGEQIVADYEPVHMNKEVVEEMTKAFLELTVMIQKLQSRIAVLENQPLRGVAGGGAGGGRALPWDYAQAYKPTWITHDMAHTTTTAEVKPDSMNAEKLKEYSDMLLSTLGNDAKKPK